MGSMVAVNLRIVEFESNSHDLKKIFKWGVKFSGISKNQAKNS